MKITNKKREAMKIQDKHRGGESMNKENKLLKFVSFVLLITIIGIILVSGTYSKYASTASGTSATVVANWSFVVNGENIAVEGDSKTIDFNLFNTINDSDGTTKETDVAEGLIAPGTSGSFEFLLQNTSDVTAQYVIDFTVTNANNIPIEYSTDGATWSKQLSDIGASEDTILAINSGVKAITVQWRWAFDGDTTVDTDLATMETAPTITVVATITATQLDKSSVANANKYDGLTVSILGDSISTLKGYIPSTNRARYVQTESEAVDGLLYMPYEKTWWGGVIEDLNMELGINESWAGSLVSNTQTADSGDKGPSRHMASMTRLQNLDNNGTPDVIFFYGGTNDIGNSITLGTFNSSLELNTTQTEYESFAEAYTMAILRMESLYPNAEIISILPTHTSTYYNDTKLAQYNAVIKEICNYYDIKYIELNNSGITTSDLADGIHPNENGMKLIKDYIVSQISTINNNNNDSGSSDNIRTTNNSHAVELPSNLTSTTNLYEVLEHESGYYKADGTFGLLDGYEEVISMTVPVVPGDRLLSNSIKSRTENNTTDGVSDGIRISYFLDDEVILTLGSADIYNEYKTNGYITVPEGANAVCMSWWQESEENTFYILTAENSTIESETKTNYYAISEKYDKYYDSNGVWNTNDASIPIVSVIVDVNPGDKLKANSFGSKETNGSNGHADGIRISFLLDSSVVSSLSPAEVYSEFTTNGYVTVPEGVNKVNVTWWNESEDNYLYIN